MSRLLYLLSYVAVTRDTIPDKFELVNRFFKIFGGGKQYGDIGMYLERTVSLINIVEIV